MGDTIILCPGDNVPLLNSGPGQYAPSVTPKHHTCDGAQLLYYWWIQLLQFYERCLDTINDFQKLPSVESMSSKITT